MPVNACAPVTITPGICSYSVAEFLAAYPEFTGIAPLVPPNNFVVAQGFLDNSCGSRVQDANQRLALLYLLTAHLTFLSNGTNDAGVVNPLSSFTAEISGTVMTVSSGVTGAPLAVGATIVDPYGVGGSALVTPGTVIASLGTGTGGAGTYNLSIAAGSPIAYETMIVPGAPSVDAAPGVVGRINEDIEMGAGPKKARPTTSGVNELV